MASWSRKLSIDIIDVPGELKKKTHSLDGGYILRTKEILKK